MRALAVGLRRIVTDPGLTYQTMGGGGSKRRKKEVKEENCVVKVKKELR